MGKSKKRVLKITAMSLGLAAMLGFAQSAGAATYEVRSGDTLYRIATENNITVNELKQMNKLTSNIIYPGQRLQVKDGMLVSYQVKKGDTLYSISRTYNMTVEELKKINNLENIIIYPAQTLKVKDANAVKYEVKKGDTLYSISIANNMTVAELKQMNNLTSNLIFPGQQLAVSKSSTINKEIKLNVQSGFQFVKEEPGIYQLFSNRDNGFFARVQLVENQATLSSMKNEAKQYLQVTGSVREVKNVSQLHSFYKNNELYMTSENGKVRQSVVVKKINGQYIKITLHLPDMEEAEDITPRLLSQLQTITF
jgi:peptidoglycan endopeptidase LytE